MSNIKFAVTPMDTDAEVCRKLANAAEAVYLWETSNAMTESRLMAELLEEFEGVRNFIGVTSAAVFAWRSNQVLIAIPGSADAYDWLGNVDAKQHDVLTLGMVHHGFYTYADALYRNFVKPQLSRLGSSRRVYVTGHSQGGAIAALVGHFASRDGYDVAKIVTFGAPRFASHEAAQNFIEPLVCFRGPCDPVPFFPWGVFRSYANAGEVRYIRDDGSVTDEAPGFFGSMFYFFRWTLSKIGIGNVDGLIRCHSMREYQSRLARMGNG